MNPLAHGLPGADDLPIPLSYALIGAAWALTFSFALLFLAWRRPRLEPESPGIPLPAPVSRMIDAPATRWVVSAASVAVTACVIVTAILGSPDPARNPVPGVLYIGIWVGVMVASLLIGPVWKVVSPVRAIHRFGCLLLRRAPERATLRYPEQWGHLPAAVGLFSFVWLELAWRTPGSVSAVLTWLIGYLVVNTIGLALFGTIWAERADPLEVYSTLLARLSPYGRDRAGRPVLRRPLNNLAGTPGRVGSVAVAAALLGSTAFDSFSAFPRWRELVDDLSPVVDATLVRTAGLLVFVGVVGGLFSLAARATGGVSPTDRALLPRRLAHSLTPIVAGYLVAHYSTFLVEKGQATALLFADPLDRGWNVAGLADRDVAYVLSSHPSVLATWKVLAVLIGHLLGVAAAHDRCLLLLPPGHRLTGQLALMLTMVGFTFTGLYLLFGG
ncbi:hypothetical protein [Nocardia caishijiensis]|uniref:Fenitrothion hydrolase n=1 Tax=Nocardia caishijiensis TaxID=184756 RepID=A0ABQ6YG85_9NOCA|nr:hypothetical protein [Nocardia caishijiensis]KAF0844807.1 hypothetical protein FNL39_11039 [Nocardia caishijiensis]